ncbi:hypothetical protein F2P81_018949 [Scophthalmus maximus]|uniref:Uncharacterized protein n=1 Tax=Scophthalmus maximus TaxID=52904 RepID=A0A6A4SG02_SCOMX|nr:hypothetical protein F2P81_018949 [Scophthalmus maximus]
MAAAEAEEGQGDFDSDHSYIMRARGSATPPAACGEGHLMRQPSEELKDVYTREINLPPIFEIRRFRSFLSCSLAANEPKCVRTERWHQISGTRRSDGMNVITRTCFGQSESTRGKNPPRRGLGNSRINRVLIV